MGVEGLKSYRRADPLTFFSEWAKTSPQLWIFCPIGNHKDLWSSLSSQISVALEGGWIKALENICPPFLFVQRICINNPVLSNGVSECETKEQIYNFNYKKSPAPV